MNSISAATSVRPAETDRELLELAAKAAGAFITKEQFEKECTSPWDPEWEPAYNAAFNSINGYRTWYGEDGDVGGWESYEWNPLTDDGDALRLGARLGLNLNYYKAHGETRALVLAELGDVYAIEFYVDDMFGATRLAIVRAAAEIRRARPI